MSSVFVLLVAALLGAATADNVKFKDCGMHGFLSQIFLFFFSFFFLMMTKGNGGYFPGMRGFRGEGSIFSFPA